MNYFSQVAYQLAMAHRIHMAAKKIRMQRGIQWVEVGNELLVALESASQPMTLNNLAKAAKMSAAKAHRYLVSCRW